MACGCNKPKANDGVTTAEVNERPCVVTASDGSETRHASYDDARRWARRVAGTVECAGATR